MTEDSLQVFLFRFAVFAACAPCAHLQERIAQELQDCDPGLLVNGLRNRSSTSRSTNRDRRLWHILLVKQLREFMQVAMRSLTHTAKSLVDMATVKSLVESMFDAQMFEDVLEVHNKTQHKESSSHTFLSRTFTRVCVCVCVCSLCNVASYRIDRVPRCNSNRQSQSRSQNRRTLPEETKCANLSCFG
jgi:hypothetical protein